MAAVLSFFFVITVKRHDRTEQSEDFVLIWFRPRVGYFTITTTHAFTDGHEIRNQSTW